MKHDISKSWNSPGQRLRVPSACRNSAACVTWIIRALCQTSRKLESVKLKVMHMRRTWMTTGWNGSAQSINITSQSRLLSGCIRLPKSYSYSSFLTGVRSVDRRISIRSARDTKSACSPIMSSSAPFASNSSVVPTSGPLLVPVSSTRAGMNNRLPWKDGETDVGRSPLNLRRPVRKRPLFLALPERGRGCGRLSTRLGRIATRLESQFAPAEALLTCAPTWHFWAIYITEKQGIGTQVTETPSRIQDNIVFEDHAVD